MPHAVSDFSVRNTVTIPTFLSSCALESRDPRCSDALGLEEGFEDQVFLVGFLETVLSQVGMKDFDLFAAFLTCHVCTPGRPAETVPPMIAPFGVPEPGDGPGK